MIPGGKLGNASALGKGFELMLALGLISKRPRIALAQAQRANPLMRSFRGGFAELVPMKAERPLASAIQTHGLKFPDFKVGYHRGALEDVKSRLANPPVELPADLDAVRGALSDL